MSLDPKHFVHEDPVPLPPWLRRTADGRVVYRASAASARATEDGRAVGRGGDPEAACPGQVSSGNALHRPATNFENGGGR